MQVDAAETAAARPAVLDGEAVVTHAELRDRALGIAAALAEAGVRPDDRVALLMRRGSDAAAAYFGALACGAVAVIVNESLRPRQIEYVLSHSGAVALLAEPDITGKLPRRIETAVPAIDPAELPASADFAPLQRDESDLAQIVYTSGSTGQPKGVMLSHGNLRAGAEVVTGYLRISGDDRIAALLPFSFDYGLNQLWCSTAKAATLVVDRSPIAARIVRTLREREVTVLACVPPLWLQLLQVEAFCSAPLPALRVMTNTGGRLPVEAVSKLRACQPHADLVLMYGLTEAFRSTRLPPERVDDKPGSIGHAIPGAEVLVVRADGSECAPGEAGQLVHRGPTVALGYWNDREASERVYRDGAVYSGDLVKRDEDGDLFFVGREDTLIKTLGYRVSPDEVAEVLYGSGQVAEALVSSEPDRERGARIVAHVVLAAGGELGRLQEFAALELPRYMQPSRVEVHDELPRTASGKHDALAIARGVAVIPADMEELLEPLERFEAIRRRVARLGDRLCDLSYANPYEDTRRSAREALAEALGDERSLDLQYSPFGGQTLARRAVADALRESHGDDFAYQDVVLTPGAMAALQIALRAAARPGEEVVIPTPCWLDIPLYARFAGLEPRLVPLPEPGFELDVDAIAEAIGERTGAVVLSQPANPSGRLYPPEALARLGDVLRTAQLRFGRPIALISDEVHRDFAERFTSPLRFHDRTVVIYSFGKYHFMQGQRLGYGAVSPHHPEREAFRRELARWTRVAGIATPTALMQKALPRLLELRHDDDWLPAWRERMVGELERAGYEVSHPDATLFVYARTPAAYEDDFAFMEDLARRGVLALPAPAFHHSGWFRLSLTASEEMLGRALPVLEEVAA